MRLLAISDLHIQDSQDPIYRSLIQLLDQFGTRGDTIVLAGDLFDLFVGNKTLFLQRYQDFFHAINMACERGVTVHYVEGNHDFLMKKAFQACPSFHHHTHSFDFEIAGKRFFVEHGDLVDKSDYRYRALRAFFRSPVIKAFVKVAPDSWIDWIGKSSSETSKKYRPNTPMPAQFEKIRHLFRNHAAERLAEGYDYVIMGHCHDLDEMCFRIGDRHGQYINVGFPRVHGSYLIWNEGDQKITREPLPG